MERTIYLGTPVGTLGVAATDTAVTRIFFAPVCDGAAVYPSGTIAAAATPLLRQAAHELEEYFAGTRREFTLPLAPSGTSFQQAVWNALRTIPYGLTRSYKQIAEQIGCPAACRAVGMANNRNPIAIVIPCHRVVGSGGKLIGYAGGLNAKAYLLNLEKEG